MRPPPGQGHLTPAACLADEPDGGCETQVVHRATEAGPTHPALTPKPAYAGTDAPRSDRFGPATQSEPAHTTTATSTTGINGANEPVASKAAAP